MTKPSRWQDAALRKSHDEIAKQPRRIDEYRLRFAVGPLYWGHLVAAANKRDLTPLAYARRAVAAFAAADQGVPITTLLADAPHPQGFAFGTHDTGTGHGNWIASPFLDDTDVL